MQIAKILACTLTVATVALIGARVVQEKNMFLLVGQLILALGACGTLLIGQKVIGFIASVGQLFLLMLELGLMGQCESIEFCCQVFLACTLILVMFLSLERSSGELHVEEITGVWV